MIQAVTTPAHKQAFATAIQGAPYFRAVMGRDLALWADSPGAPVRLFTLPGAALTLNGSTAQLCGTPPGLGGTAELFAVCGHRPSDCGRNATTARCNGGAAVPV